MFKVSGIWVSPFEVESALVAARDPNGLEKSKAFVVLNDGVDNVGLDEVLNAHVKGKIGK